MNPLLRQLQQIRSEARKSVLKLGPDPVVELRVRRDVLDVAVARTLVADVAESPQVRSLADEQRADGSWGRLHSEDTTLGLEYATTEFAVRRAVSLGLTETHAMLRRARSCLARYIRSGDCPDPAEKNDRWPTGVRLFAASTLALFAPKARESARVRKTWLRIGERTFADGNYDANREAAAHADLTGATMKGTYLALDNRYALELLASCDALAPGLGASLADWVADSGRGIRYLSEPLRMPPLGRAAGRVDRWLTSVHIAVALGPSRERLQQLVHPILESRGDDGLWDFGPRPERSAYLPLSQSWRRIENRKADWTTRVLLVLKEAERVAGTHEGSRSVQREGTQR